MQEQQTLEPEGEENPARRGKAMTIGLMLALAAIMISTESSTVLKIVRLKFSPYALPQIFPLFGTGLTPLEHLAGLLRCVICLGGAVYAGHTASRMAPRSEFVTGMTIFLGCAAAYASVIVGHETPVGFYGALCILLFPVFLSAGIWQGWRQNRRAVPVATRTDRARPVAALACAVFAQWLLPMLLLHAYAHLTTGTQGQPFFADPAFEETRRAFGEVNLTILTGASAIAGGYLCICLARRSIIVVGPVLLVFLGYPVLRVNLDPFMGPYFRGEYVHLGLFFLGMAAGWAHMRIRSGPATPTELATGVDAA